MRALTLLLCVLLASCAAVNPRASFVAGKLAASDADVLAAASAEHFRTVFPAAKSSIALETPAVGQERNAFAVSLDAELRRYGYAVSTNSPSSPAPADAIRVRYVVSPLDSGLVLQLQYGGAEVARYFARDRSGVLVAASPYTLKEVK